MLDSKEISSEDIELLNRYFSTKTMFNVSVYCDEEARQVLQASLTDPSIRHAILSLRTLREDLETSGDVPASMAPRTSNYQYGLQQYNMALGGLASSLSFPGFNALKSALLCCQIFISIEQVRKDYAAMAQHIIRGLRIMHEYRARPAIDTANQLVPASHDKLPYLDVFIIKLFAAPCKFAELPATSSTCSSSPYQSPGGHIKLPTIAPNMRTELVGIATRSLEYLEKVSQVKSVEIALGLLSEKAALLKSLGSWFTNLESLQAENKSSCPEPISTLFLRLFYSILKIVLLGALLSSPGLDAEIRVQSDRLTTVADDVGERLKTYSMCSGTIEGRPQGATKC